MERNPVLLIHGINDTAKIFRRMRAYLEVRGWEVHAISLSPNNGDSGLDELALQIDRYVEQTFARSRPIDLLGFSMGGIICRYYVQRLGGIARVERLITLASPHNGSLMAYLRWNIGCEQMRPNSPFLRDLNRQLEQLTQVQFTSIWTPMDLMILPAVSSSLPIGTDIKLSVLAHAWMVSDPGVLLAVATALSRPLNQNARRTPAEHPQSLIDRVPQTRLPDERNT
ncbi:esterase/lipase family protein [Trichothermofontia sp.]